MSSAPVASYEDRYVAFVDVLGWGNFVDEATTDPSLLDKLIRAVTAMPGGNPHDASYPNNPRFTQFSDSLVISAKADLEGRHNLQQRIWMMWDRLMRLDLFIRGGIARGKMYHQDGIAIGPALADAYKIESQISTYPRITLAHDLRDWGRKDSDGEYFFDLLRYYHKVDVPDHHADKWGFYEVPAFDPLVKETIERAYRKHANPASKSDKKIIEKYEWYAKYFNKVAEEMNSEMEDAYALRLKPTIAPITIGTTDVPGNHPT